MSIFVDDRTGSNRLMRYEPFATDGELVRMDFGDVAFVGNGPDDEPVMVGVEIKSIFDLISSMDTGRLQGTQLPGMLENYGAPWLVYYGEYRPGRDGVLEIRRGKFWRNHRIGTRYVPYGYVESFLFDLVISGVAVKHVIDEATAAAWIGCLYRWWSKPWSKHKGLRALDRSGKPSLLPDMDPDTRFRAMVAKELPGVGFERAIAAARYFPSVEAMINASAAEWAEVEGVGKVIAKAIYAAVR